MVQAGVRLLDVGSCFDPIREILKKGSEGPKFPVSVEVRCHGNPTQPPVPALQFLPRLIASTYLLHNTHSAQIAYSFSQLLSPWMRMNRSLVNINCR
jgi:hypothetical protein